MLELERKGGESELELERELEGEGEEREVKEGAIEGGRGKEEGELVLESTLVPLFLWFRDYEDISSIKKALLIYSTEDF